MHSLIVITIIMLVLLYGKHKKESTDECSFKVEKKPLLKKVKENFPGCLAFSLIGDDIPWMEMLH